MRKQNNIDSNRIVFIFSELKQKFSSDWLLPLEMYELIYKSKLEIETELFEFLTKLKRNKKISNLITNGIAIITQN